MAIRDELLNTAVDALRDNIRLLDDQIIYMQQAKRTLENKLIELIVAAKNDTANVNLLTKIKKSIWKN